MWSFDWWAHGLYRMLGDDPDTMFEQFERVPSPKGSFTSAHPLDRAWATTQQRRPSWTPIIIELPTAYTDSLQIKAYPHFDINSAWSEWDYHHFNAGTGALTEVLLHEDKTTAEKFANSKYPIHTGAIWGWPTKVLATFASLVCSVPLSAYHWLYDLVRTKEEEKEKASGQHQPPLGGKSKTCPRQKRRFHLLPPINPCTL